MKNVPETELPGIPNHFKLPMSFYRKGFNDFIKGYVQYDPDANSFFKDT